MKLKKVSGNIFLINQSQDDITFARFRILVSALNSWPCMNQVNLGGLYTSHNMTFLFAIIMTAFQAITFNPLITY
jgi:hypothetical protein